MKTVKRYLENPICDFTPLFNIDYRRRQNIVSACFFKIYGGGYKNFSKYTNGIVNLSKHIDKNMKGFTLRLFIDRSVYEDKDIMKILNKLNIDLVLYECTDFMKEDKYHKGLFGTLLRFFPLFDFPNNDSNIVAVSDIDVPNIEESKRQKNTVSDVYEIYKKNEKFIKKAPFTIYYHSNFYKQLRRTKYDMFYKNYMYTYVLSTSIVGFKKLENESIVKFLKNVEKFNKSLTFYRERKLNQDTNFIFGVDEYFTSETLKKYIIDNKKPFVQNISYIITGDLYFQIMDYKKCNKEYKKFFRFVLRDFQSYPKDSLIQNFKFIDKIIYYFETGAASGHRKMTKNQELIFFRIYQYFIKIYNTNEVKYYSKNFLDIILRDIFIGLPSVNFSLVTDFKNDKIYFINGLKLPEKNIQFLIDMKKQYKINLPKINLPQKFENI
jgi:hypothetical protein